jgi:hypothetical protein
LRDRLDKCESASLVAGSLTVEGLETIAQPLQTAPGKLKDLVVGGGTWRAFDALDRLLKLGVPSAGLHVHLGHSRATGTGAVHRFYRYHPMLHSKIYMMEMGDGSAAAFVGSHNLTGFALLGLNGEAGVLLEGKGDAPEFVALREHVAEAVAQAVPYDPAMKDAYAWWTGQFLDGLRAKADDIPDDAENKRTIVVIAAQAGGTLPQKDEVIYFEIPEALGRIQSLRAEVHIYVFAVVPPSPTQALGQLASATASLWCKTEGLEMGRGGVELRANWYIDDRRNPVLRPTPKPFRPTPAAGMQQVRVRVTGPVFGNFEYLFDRGRIDWMPLFDDHAIVEVPAPTRSTLDSLNLVPREDLPWQRVRGLEPASPAESNGYEEPPPYVVRRRERMHLRLVLQSAKCRRKDNTVVVPLKRVSLLFVFRCFWITYPRWTEKLRPFKHRPLHLLRPQESFAL